MRAKARKTIRLLFLFVFVNMGFGLLWISSRLRGTASSVKTPGFEIHTSSKFTKGKPNNNNIANAQGVHLIYKGQGNEGLNDVKTPDFDRRTRPKYVKKTDTANAQGVHLIYKGQGNAGSHDVKTPDLDRPTRPKHVQKTRNRKYHVEDMKKLNKAKVAADNQRLVQLIRDYYIVPPSTEPYNLEFPEKNDSSVGQAPIVDSRLQYKEHGFYVESGAFDGETLSNTLFFEQKRHWTGILIEPNPSQYEKLVGKHRKAFSINACLSTEDYPSEKVIVDDHLTSKIIQGRTSKTTYTVQCFPLYSILLALNQTDIHYLSLDVEGHEKGVLGTIPWHKVNIQMMTIEYNKYPGGETTLCKDMVKRGYECVARISKMFVDDVVLAKKT